VRADMMALIASLGICLIGGVALAAYALRFRSRERDLLWIGMFAVLYGADLLLHNPLFQLGFGGTRGNAVFLPRILSACSIVPALLLFEEFYGRGWRSLLHWMIVGYGVAAAGVYGYMTTSHRPEMMPSAGLLLVVCVPAVLVTGRLSGYHPPRLENANVLFTGLLCFFLAFSADHLRNARDGQWKPGLEPYGFIVLLLCLSFVATKRVLTDERHLDSLTREMQAAAATQVSILSRSIPPLDRAQVAVRYMPATAVAGDFYDFPETSPDCLDILLVDVMGHGVPAALVASMIKVAVRANSRQGEHPGRTMATLNSILCDVAPGHYVTGVYFQLNFSTGTGTYSVAAHPSPLLWSRAWQQAINLNGGGLLLGVRKHESYGNFQFRIRPGERLLLYTDGLTEAENAIGESFGDVMLPRFMREHEAMDVNAFADGLQHAVREWSLSGKHGQADDITFIVVDLAPPQ
jgi:phosphoserine phosphatase RsbU/P